MLLHVIDIAHVSAKFTGLCPAAGTRKVERLPLKANDRLEWGYFFKKLRADLDK